MTHVIIDSKELNLSEEFAKKLKSRKVELVETEEGILIRSVTDAVQRAKGFLKGSNFTLDKYLKEKQKEKELE